LQIIHPLLKFLVELVIAYANAPEGNISKRKRGKRKRFSTKTQKLTLLRQRNLCADCGIFLLYPEFHHKDGDRKNNYISNCEALCPNCHAKKTRKKRKRISA